MLATNGRMKIAIQRNGRLTEDSTALLRACGLSFEFQKQSLYSPCRNFDLDVLAIRDDDIPEYVQDGVADLGIIGENILQERKARVQVLAPLGFGGCKLMISVPQKSAIRKITDLKGKRIGTTYPTILKSFLNANKVRAEIIKLSGSVELAPSLNVADVICDIVSTGTTAKMSGLRTFCTVMESQAVLVANPAAMCDKKKRKLIDRLMIRVRGSQEARGKRYLMMNAPFNSLQKLKHVIPSLKSPTVVPLAEKGMVAIHSVVAEDVFWDVMEKLKQAGASDIIVVPIETIIR
jgi:ATP phosphoribosyltransferase